MLKNKRILWITLPFVIAAFAVLCSKIGYPHHRIWALFVFVLGLIPVGVSYYLNRRVLRVNKRIVRKRTRPLRPYIIVALLIAVAIYVTQVLIPVKESPLVKMDAAALRAEMEVDLDHYLVLRGAIDNLVSRFEQNGLLKHDVATLSVPERETIEKLWRQGFILFVECDMLKEKYGGFYQVDYNAKPKLHTDAFFLAYATYIAQYQASLTLYNMVDSNAFMETLLNESAPGLPNNTFYVMKTLLAHPQVILRANAGAIYYELVKDDLTFNKKIVKDFEKRRKDFFATQLRNPKIYIENPLGILEDAAFKAWFPLQKQVALQMSNIRATNRDYLIPAEVITALRSRLEPGDILLQRRNWYMTNVGIPGFWPHAALYLGTMDDLEAYFGEDIERLKSEHPALCTALQSKDADGHPLAVIEAIKAGVILQSFEKSAHCDYLAVIRPKLTKSEMLEVVLNACSHYQKPYDLNFDFTTDNAIVCSELVYKAYNPVNSELFTPEIVNGRLLLPANLMAEQISNSLGKPDSEFTLVLFLDAVESEKRVFESGVEEFMKSCNRPKWYMLQH